MEKPNHWNYAQIDSFNPETPFLFNGVCFDPRDGAGSVGYTRDVNYFGFVAFLPPSVFLRLSPAVVGEYQKTLPDMERLLPGGVFCIAPPILYLKENSSRKGRPRFRIIGHEGRHRATALRNLGFGSIPVFFKLPTGMRSDKISPGLMKELSRIAPEARGKKSVSLDADFFIIRQQVWAHVDQEERWVIDHMRSLWEKIKPTPVRTVRREEWVGSGRTHYWSENNPDRREHHEGSTGKVEIEGDVVIKNATGLESEVYGHLCGVPGIAPADTVGNKIHIKKYQGIIGVDDVPSKHRKLMAPIITKNLQRITRAISELSAQGYAYRDQLQFGFNADTHEMDMIDFSAATKMKPEDALIENLDLLSGFLRMFGLKKTSRDIAAVSNTWILATTPEARELMRREPEVAEVVAMLDRLGGIPRFAYYTHNRREVQLPGIAQTKHRDGRVIVLSEYPVRERDISQYDLVPVIAIET